MQGVSFGERKFLFTGKSIFLRYIGYFYDDVDGLFLELAFNPYKKGMLSFGKQSHPSDWVEGSILKITPAFSAKFRGMKKKKGPTKK
jgi:hypothetical protein